MGRSPSTTSPPPLSGTASAPSRPLGVGSAEQPSIDSLTSLRGLAALWVVLYHFAGDLFILLPASAVLRPFIEQGHFAVPIFFVLSGYVLTYNYLHLIGPRLSPSILRRFWGRRLLRIYPLHLVTLLAVLAMVIGARSLNLSISEDGYGRRDFALNLLLMQTWVPHFELNWNYPSWSISSEWFAYLFFPIACLGLIRVRRPWTLLGLGLTVYVFTIALAILGGRLPFREMIAVVGPFLLGCILARMTGLGLVPRDRMRIEAWALSIAFVSLPFVAPASAMFIGLLTAGAALVFVLGATGEGCSRFWLLKPLVVLGEVSYSLYMVHTLVQKLVNEILPAARFADRSTAIRLAVLLTYAVSIILVTWVAHRWVDVLLRKSIRRRLEL